MKKGLMISMLICSTASIADTNENYNTSEDTSENYNTSEATSENYNASEDTNENYNTSEDTNENYNACEASNGFIFGVGLANIDPDVAANAQVDDSAVSIRVGWEYRQSDYIFGAGIGGLIYDDKADYDQLVVDQYGNISTEESSADAFSFYIEGGYEYSINPYFYTDFIGGYEQTLVSSRAISNCGNCYDSDIDVDAGLYINPRLTIIFQSTAFLSLGYQHYLNGDIDNNIMLNIGFGAQQH